MHHCIEQVSERDRKPGPPAPIKPAGGTYAHSPSPEPPYLGKKISKDIPLYLRY